MVRSNDILNHFTWTVAAGKSGLEREITSAEINRPGLELAGYFQFFEQKRIQVIGKKEMEYFSTLSEKEKQERVKKLCDKDVPAIIFSKNRQAPEIFLQCADRAEVPIFVSPQPTTTLISRLSAFLEAALAARTSVHGVLVEIDGIGVLIRGKSGIGKSETALELIKRGHRLVADDRVEVRQEEELLVGSAPPLIRHLIEIRGLGIIDIRALFGASAIVSQKEISLLINIEAWEDKKQYERLGIEYTTERILDIDIPELTLPIRPGRNLAVIIEVAVMNYRLKQTGINAAFDFTNHLEQQLKLKQNRAD